MLLMTAITIGARAEAASRTVYQSDHDHDSTKAREVTYDEAHDLLTAFLKVRPLAVEKSGDLGYKEFYFSWLTWVACPAAHALGRAKREST